MPFLTVAAFGAILAFRPVRPLLPVIALLRTPRFIPALALIAFPVAIAGATVVLLARTTAHRDRWLGGNLQTLRLDAAQGAAQFFHFAFVGNFLPFGNFHELEHFLDVIHHLLEGLGNVRGIFHGLGNGGGFGGTEIRGLHPNFGARRFGTRRFRSLIGSLFATLITLVVALIITLLARFVAFLALLAFLAQFVPVFGAQRTLVAGSNGRCGRGFSRRLRSFPGRLAFLRFAGFRFGFRFLAMVVCVRRLMAVGLILAINGFDGGVSVKFARFAGFAGFVGVRFAEAAGIIGFNRINPVVFRGVGMGFRSRLERFGHGGNGVNFLHRRSG